MIKIASLLVLPLVVSPACCLLNKSDVTPQPPKAVKSEVYLPPPSLVQRLYETTSAILETPWTGSEDDSRQGPIGGGIRVTLGGLVLIIMATGFGMLSFTSVGLLAAKALSIGTLALFLTAMSSFKRHKSDSSGQTVHYVPIHSGHSHHDYIHDRAEYLPPFIDRNV